MYTKEYCELYNTDVSPPTETVLLEIRTPGQKGDNECVLYWSVEETGGIVSTRGEWEIRRMVPPPFGVEWVVSDFGNKREYISKKDR